MCDAEDSGILVTSEKASQTRHDSLIKSNVSEEPRLLLTDKDDDMDSYTSIFFQ